ncbi:DNA-3-methyladenine glycosylase [Pseudalkalibacillus salsuginis]|uniref:DNA-3-methyladenine glycosylase n=1 Tax=Pseudalkalibacillus salsuginis TaxID=2910972 RepID=UPI001F3D7265|nr:DNA-3-methyladenine glycosylase [Pseudalkalibacillus salsuginis]MCF6408888.1 DNA-3-methyladenine glycosylase [Pseudalkalibacillus salsuginis]
MNNIKQLFNKETLELANNLLGMELVHDTEYGEIAGKIVEVEAYKGPEDKAAHSFGGRRTTRTEVMYGEPGHVYMFLIYGMHHCFNVVSGPIGKPEAVLVRALEPTSGIDQMLLNRYGEKPKYTKTHHKNLTNGPGKLCRALGLNMGHYGLPINQSEIQLRPYENIKESDITVGPRVNIDYAEEHVNLPWRFSIRGNPYVS